jgi:hypothetical protein
MVFFELRADDALAGGPMLVFQHPAEKDRWLCKEAKFKAREARGVRRTSCTPQRQRAEAQRRNWPLYKAISFARLPAA